MPDNISGGARGRRRREARLGAPPLGGVRGSEWTLGLKVVPTQRSGGLVAWPKRPDSSRSGPPSPRVHHFGNHGFPADGGTEPACRIFIHRNLLVPVMHRVFIDIRSLRRPIYGIALIIHKIPDFNPDR